MEGEVEISEILKSKSKNWKILQLCPRNVIYLQLEQRLQELSPVHCWPAATGEGSSAIRD